MYMTPSQAALCDFENRPTFQHDDELPKLPVPDPADTIKRYLTSLRPLVTPSELVEAEQLAKDFLEKDASRLQKILLERAHSTENWMSDWWLNYAYLNSRGPLMPFSNCGGTVIEINPDRSWRLHTHADEALENYSLLLYFLLTFYLTLKKEALMSEVDQKGRKMNMYQFRNIYGTARIPGKDRDSMRHNWSKEKNESFQHVIVLRNGHIFIVTPFKEDGSPYSATELLKTLKKIRHEADDMPEGPGLGALPCAERSEWAENRDILVAQSQENQENLELIESSLMCVSLDKYQPRDFSDCSRHLSVGNAKNRWPDKSATLIIYDNGYGGINGEHSSLDGFTVFTLVIWAQLGIDDEKSGLAERPREWANHKLPLADAKPKRLQFKLNDHLRSAISSADNLCRELHDNLRVKRTMFAFIGKNRIKNEVKFHPDTFVQLCLQLAYYRLHGKFASVYESATTRQFRLGRTDTLRSCTPECAEMCRAMVSRKDPALVRRLLHTAHDTHNRLMEEAKCGQACDRHLMGFMLAAVENGLEIPPLFLHPTYAKSGGNGNYTLSTSLAGYTGLSGGAAPMHTDGYGAFYNFENIPEKNIDRIWVFGTAYGDSHETSLEKFHFELGEAFKDVAEIVTAGKAKL